MAKAARKYGSEMAAYNNARLRAPKNMREKKAGCNIHRRRNGVSMSASSAPQRRAYGPVEISARNIVYSRA